MALLFNWWLLDLTAVTAGLLAALYYYLTIVYSYWEKRGIPYVKPTFPFGNISDSILVRRQFGLLFMDFYIQLTGHKVGGIFQIHRPTLILRDLDIIKSFLVRDFSNFHDRGIYADVKNDPLSNNIFFMTGLQWKNLRAKLTPVFTSGKMKMMFQTVLDCGQELTECLQEIGTRGDTIEVKDFVSRYSTDVIASCAFGVEGNCIQNPDAEFRQKGREFFSPGVVKSVGLLLNIMAPSVAALTKLGHTPSGPAKFFLKMVKETVEYREKNDVTRNDLMHLMIQLKNKGYLEEDVYEKNSHVQKESEKLKKLTFNEVAAQAFVFFIAGFETSSTTVSFCLYELAVNPDIQERMRSEIDTVLTKHGGQLTYDAMQDMEYMDMVVAETLRKYPPVPVLNRECNTAYTLPDGVVVEPGTPVVVPVYGLHHDPQYYPDPERFDPQRFTPEMKSSRNQYCYLPFGEGPRICIGMRFGYMQTKVALISLLARYEFHVSDKTRVPLIFDNKSFTLSPEGGLYLKIVNRA